MVQGLDTATIGELSQSDEVFWSNGQVELTGVLEAGVLRVMWVRVESIEAKRTIAGPFASTFRFRVNDTSWFRLSP